MAGAQPYSDCCGNYWLPAQRKTVLLYGVGPQPMEAFNNAIIYYNGGGYIPPKMWAGFTQRYQINRSIRYN